MVHDCKFEDRIIEMSGDIKTLLSEFKTMNGKLVTTKEGFEKHDDESVDFRDKVNMLWAVLHSAKWIITVMLSGGVLGAIMMKIMEK